MDKHNVTYAHGHGFLPHEIKRLLYMCKAKQAGRYAIHGVCVETGALVTTNGIQLIRIELLHMIPPGNYCCTADGWLIYPMDEPFVPYQTLLPPHAKLEVVGQVKSCSPFDVAHIVKAVYQKECYFNSGYFAAICKVLDNLDAYDITIFVALENTAQRGFILEGSLFFERKFKYLQAPMI